MYNKKTGPWKQICKSPSYMGELMRMEPMSLCLVKLLNLCLVLCLVIERLLEISLKLYEVVLRLFVVSLRIFEVVLRVSGVVLSLFDVDVSLRLFEVVFRLFEVVLQLLEVSFGLWLFWILLHASRLGLIVSFYLSVNDFSLLLFSISMYICPLSMPVCWCRHR